VIAVARRVHDILAGPFVETPISEKTEAERIGNAVSSDTYLVNPADVVASAAMRRIS
jgi:hypothetical protein